MNKEEKLRKAGLILFWIATAALLTWFIIKPHLANNILQVTYVPAVVCIFVMYIVVCILNAVANKYSKQKS